MNLFYYRDPAGNFGDDLNAWIWDLLLPGYRDVHDDVTLIGVGTLLNTQLPLPSNRKLVIGSGTGYGTVPLSFPASEWDLRCVRGPDSAGRVGLPPDRGILDPAGVLPTLAGFGGPRQVTGAKPLFVPHHSNADRHPWDNICTAAGLEYLSPKMEAHHVIRRIAAAPLVVAESLHAAIIADAFRTPWIAVNTSGTVNRPKWMDWARSLELELDLVELFPEFGQVAGTVRGLRRTLSGKTPQKRVLGLVELPVACEIDALGCAAPPPARPLTYKKRARIALERPFLVGRLRRLVASGGSLSDQGVLEAAWTRYHAVVQETARDYGLT